MNLSFAVRYSQRRKALLPIRVPAEQLEIAPIEAIAQRDVQRDLCVVEVHCEVTVRACLVLVLNGEAAVVVKLVPVQKVRVQRGRHWRDVLFDKLVRELRREPNLVQQHTMLVHRVRLPFQISAFACKVPELCEELVTKLHIEAVERVDPVGWRFEQPRVGFALFARTHELDEATGEDGGLIEPPDVGELRLVSQRDGRPPHSFGVVEPGATLLFGADLKDRRLNDLRSQPESSGVRSSQREPA
jgi:hypothetical protein